jgi:hypothetical protein
MVKVSTEEGVPQKAKERNKHCSRARAKGRIHI